MERILPNVIRFSGPYTKKELGHSYLLLRDEGNVLVACHSGPRSPGELEEVEQLGGIASQWVCHQHDVNRHGLHEELYARFGCKLHHQFRDEKGVRKRTACPVEHFGDDGLTCGTDFEAHYYPSCMDGHSIYRWRSGGKYLLFTSHSFLLRGDEWQLHVPAAPKLRRDLMRPQLPKVAKLRIDYVLPGYSGSEVDGDGYYKLNGRTRRSLKEAFGKKIEGY